MDQIKEVFLLEIKIRNQKQSWSLYSGYSYSQQAANQSTRHLRNLISNPNENPGSVFLPVHSPPHNRHLIVVISKKKMDRAETSIVSPSCGWQSQGISKENGSIDAPAPLWLVIVQVLFSMEPLLELGSSKNRGNSSADCITIKS